ncbi:DUF3575 domain-containing protein [Costertonia aggregata]|nr:DUF3575 domain-containing protein [Costertonia aggregata]
MIILFIITNGYFSNAQAYPQFENDHEIKLNIGLFLATTTVEGSYEYFLNQDVSIGGTLYADNDAADYNGNFGIGPNVRAYFGYRPRSGFFAEAFGLYYTGEEETQNNTAQPSRDYNTFALGLGIGNKWVTRSQKFSLEINAGLGRNVKTEEFQNTFMYRAGLSLGFRF